MAMIQLPPDFKEFLNLLNEREIDYLLIGGYAVASYGYVRATADIDIWVAVSEENARKILDALAEFGFPNVSKELFLNPDQISRMGLPPFRIEMMTSIDGVEFEDCYANRIAREIDGITVPLIALSDLRINKKASGRLKDLSDLEHLPVSVPREGNQNDD